MHLRSALQVKATTEGLVGAIRHEAVRQVQEVETGLERQVGVRVHARVCVRVFLCEVGAGGGE